MDLNTMFQIVFHLNMFLYIALALYKNQIDMFCNTARK